MGGSGSGRYSGWGRYTTDDCHHIAAGELARTAKDFLSGGYSSYPQGGGVITWSRGERKTGSIGFGFVGQEGGYSIILDYVIDDKEKVKERIPLDTTRLVSGGLRWWFRCLGCGKRVGKLYCRAGRFRCRDCQNLTYRSSQESHKFDSLYRSLAADMGGVYSPEMVKRALNSFRAR